MVPAVIVPGLGPVKPLIAPKAQFRKPKDLIFGFFVASVNMMLITFIGPFLLSATTFTSFQSRPIFHIGAFLIQGDHVA